MVLLLMMMMMVFECVFDLFCGKDSNEVEPASRLLLRENNHDRTILLFCHFAIWLFCHFVHFLLKASLTKYQAF